MDKHINAAGLCGGNSLCGGKGSVAFNEEESTCIECHKIVRDWHTKRNEPVPAWVRA